MFDKISPHPSLPQPRLIRRGEKERNTRKSPPLEKGDQGGFYKLYITLFFTFVLNTFPEELIVAANQIFTVFSKAELVTTDNELIAIAAAAMIGLRRPKAAMGIATVL